MKQPIIKIAFVFACFFAATRQSATAQVLELITLVTNKVIKAIDLHVQEMQNAVIALQNEQRQAENHLSKEKLAEIGDWQKKQKELYANYYASLKQVKPLIGASAIVQNILKQQKTLVEQYNIALSKTQTDPHFTLSEKTTIKQTYVAIINEGSTILDKLEQALRNNNIQATDVERLKLTTQSANQMNALQYKYQTLYSRNLQLSLQRAKDLKDAETVRRLYGIQTP